VTEFLLRRAVPADSETLTAIAQAAKAHWRYPPDWLELWRDGLTVTPQFIAAHLTLCAELAGKIVGFAAVAESESGWELEHMWVLPAYMGQGIGRDLLGAILGRLAARGATSLRIASDPHAVGFYEQLGAQVVGVVDSLPTGRRLPLLTLPVSSPFK
jgi:GNAT superfamily N-acetyltransferase